MSEEQLKAFLAKVQADVSLQEKLKAAANSDAVVSIAKEEGFSISTDDLTKPQSLTEEELEGVAGGLTIIIDTIVHGIGGNSHCGVCN